MLRIGRKVAQIVILCIIAWNNSFCAKGKTVYFERLQNISYALTSSNPSFLKDIEDKGLVRVKSFYNFGKGGFVNYFSPDQINETGINTESYKRLNNSTVVYGFASYEFSKGKNCNGTSFLDPYQVPFDFNEIDEATKGDRQKEHYNLIGALSHQISNKIFLGAKIDYETISLAKLKDIRNTNDILNLIVSPGLTYIISENQSLGISYEYNRFIENMFVEEYGNIDRDYRALINKGAFMGSYILYGDNGLLKEDSERPWIDITHRPSIQYNIFLSQSTSLFMEFVFKQATGHFGNEGDASIVFMRHKENGGALNSQLSIKKKNNTHLISLRSSYDRLSNKEQLYNQVKTSGGSTVTEYYGQTEALNRTKINAKIRYQYFWGDEYFKAPWQFNFTYQFNNLKRIASYYPFYRKQDLFIHSLKMGIEKTIRSKNVNYQIKLSNQLNTGNGGNPVDGTYANSSGSTKTPDYQDNLLNIEKEYLTASQITSILNIGAEHSSKRDFGIYYEIEASFTKPLKTVYLNGNFFNIGLNVGFIF